MSLRPVSDISKSLDPLRSVVSSLSRARDGEIPVGPDRRKLVRHVRSASGAALPALMRSLASPLEAESSWAYYLLARLGGDRVVSRLSELLADRSAADEVKARALGLLSDLNAPIPSTVALHDPEALLEGSVRDLLRSLDEPAELEQAVQLIMGQVPQAELASFVGEVLRHGGGKALPLLEQLLRRDDLAADVRTTLEGLVSEATASRAERVADQALDRGLAYLEAGRPEAARRKLERFVKTHPEHAEGRSALGVCLLQLQEAELAIVELKKAAELEPDEPLHAWNLAAAAKEADRLGGAYLALRDYLSLVSRDLTDGADERRLEARSFVRAYERALGESHPGVTLADFLRGEELFARAYAALAEDHPDDAARGFEAVLALMPRHYPSWGNLGAAYLKLGRFAESKRALQRALELNPQYHLAQENLELLAKGLRSRPG